jgi:hypothetical protein
MKINGRCLYEYEGRMLTRQRIWQLKNPEKYKAQKAAWSGIFNIGLEKRCEVCGSRSKIERHHEDHSKPFEIKWLCKKHHIEADQK